MSKTNQLLKGAIVKVRGPIADPVLKHIEGREGEIVGGYELPWGRGWSYTVRVDGLDYDLGEGEIEAKVQGPE